MQMTRRQALIGTGAALGATLLGRAATQAQPVTLDLIARETRANIIGSETAGMFSYGDGGPAPILRLRQSDPALIRFENRLKEMTTVHWHGIRVPHAMDGVAWVSQFPMNPGESYEYAFTPQDAGTYWYHPHCNTFEQISRGLNGILIVEEPVDPGFDDDLPLLLRDFRLDEAGQFTALSVPRNAARGGTLGKVMTANWKVDPVVEASAGGLARLRLVNSDVTRVHQLFLPGAEGLVIALDGHPLEVPFPVPVDAALALPLAPGQRADVALRMPVTGQLDLMTDTTGGQHRLAQIVASGADRRRVLADLAPLPPNPVAMPDLADAPLIDFVFGWSPAGDATGGSSLCGETGKRFWSINRIAAAADGPEPGAPLASLDLGQSYRLRLRNETQNDHPVHLHGLAMRVLASSSRPVVPHWTDTVLLTAEETLEVALVADNPGDWIFHCHVIEHQKTGLSGFLRVV